MMSRAPHYPIASNISNNGYAARSSTRRGAAISSSHSTAAVLAQSIQSRQRPNIPTASHISHPSSSPVVARSVRPASSSSPSPSDPSASSSSSPAASANFHVAITDIDSSDTDVKVSVSVSCNNNKANQSSRSMRSNVPRLPEHHRPSLNKQPQRQHSSISTKPTLSSSLFGSGRWSLCGQLIFTGVLVTLLVSLITIPLLLFRVESQVEDAVAHTNYQAADEEHARVLSVFNTYDDDKEQLLAAAQPFQKDTDAYVPSLTMTATSPAAAAAEDEAVIELSDPQPASPTPVSGEEKFHNEVTEVVVSSINNSAAGIFVSPSDLPVPFDEIGSDLPEPQTKKLRVTEASFNMMPGAIADQPELMNSSAADLLTIFTTFSPNYLHIPHTAPIHSWSLLFRNSSAHIVVYVPDDLTCTYLMNDHHLPITCVSTPVCFDDRNRIRRRKVNKGQLVWEFDRDARREGKMICIMKQVNKDITTPLVAYMDHEMIVTSDLIQTVDTIIQHVKKRAAEKNESPSNILTLLRQRPFMLIGRSWDVSISTLADHVSNNNTSFQTWVNDLQLSSMQEHHRYLSSFSADDIKFFATHNTYPLHWFVFLRGSLPLHAISKSTYMSDEDEDEATHHDYEQAQDDSDDPPGPESGGGMGWHMAGAAGDYSEHHGWESFVVWAAKSKAKPPVSIIDTSEVVHLMRTHRHATHDHASHAFPPSLAVIPADSNQTEIARLTSNITDYHPNNPVSVPLSPAVAHYRLVGDCFTECHLVRNADPSIATMLTSVANIQQQVILLSVNTEYLSMAYNWICRAKALNISSFLFIAEDRLSYFALLSRNIPVTLVNYARTRKPTAFTETNSSWLFDETLYYRAQLLQQAVQRLNLAVLILHLDVVLFSDPLPLLLNNEHRCDVLVSMNGSTTSGGMFYYPVTELSRRLVAEMSRCEEENVQFAHIYGGNRFVFSDTKEGSCVSQLTTRLITRYKFRRCTFDPRIFPSEEEFFALQSPQHAAYWPVTTHIQLQKSIENKSKVMKEWSLWWYQEEDRDILECDERKMRTAATLKRNENTQSNRVQCLINANHLSVSSPSLAVTSSFVIHLHLLASASDTASFESSFSSLTSASRALPVNLYIDIAGENLQQQEQLAADVLLKRWEHGSLSLNKMDPSIVSPNAEWMQTWMRNIDNTTSEGSSRTQTPLILTMIAGQRASPYLFSSLLALLQSSSLHLDSSLVSVSLIHHPAILAETPEHRYRTRTIVTVLEHEIDLFRYQVSHIAGSLFSLPALARFLSWYQSHKPDANESLPSTYPCIPTLVSNRWYLAQPQRYFSQWLHRYHFEHGLYSLHLYYKGNVQGQLYQQQQVCAGLKPDVLKWNPNCSTPLALVTESPTQNPHATHISLLSEPLVFETEVNIALLPLFDFHLFPVSPSLSNLESRSLMYAPHNPYDRTEGSRMDDMQDVKALEASILMEDTAFDEEEKPATPMLSVPLVARTADFNETDTVVKTRKIYGEEQLRWQRLIRLLMFTEYRSMKQRIPLQNNPYNLSYPDSLQDRCFVFDSPADVFKEEEDEELRIKPFVPPSNHPAYESLSALHQQLVDIQLPRLLERAEGNDRAARVVIYRPEIVANGATVSIPFDRMLRGLYFSFLLSICLDRMLIIDAPGITALYDSPLAEPTSWLYETHKAYLSNLPADTLTSTHQGTLRNKDLQSVFRRSILYYKDLISLDRPLMSNKYYRWLPLALFESLSRVHRTGAIMQHLLSRPKQSLSLQAAALAQQLHLTDPLYTAIGLRIDMHDEGPFPSVTQPFPGLSPSYFSCVDALIASYSAHPNRTLIFFTSNKPAKVSYDYIQSRYHSYGKILTYTEKMEKVKHQMSVSMGGVAVNIEAEHLIGFILANLSTVIMSDTTFGIFQSPRLSGYRDKESKYFIIVQDDQRSAVDYCGPIQRRDKSKRMDIIF